MKLNEFDYNLPQSLIAQVPSKKREESSLLVMNRENKIISHKKFLNIIELLSEKDVLVLNNTKVIPARLIGKKSTGAVVEVFLLSLTDVKNVWQVLIKPSKRVKEGTEIIFSEELKAKVLQREEDKWLVELIYEGNFDEIINKNGEMPLPPYIQRKQVDEKIKQLDLERYQTVFAQNPGSVAAPTAGLHFSEEILDKLIEKKVEICYVNLNVGFGTFKPVKVENILDHKMDREYYEIPQKTVETIKKAKLEGKNIVAVGTTTVRTLETASDSKGNIISLSGWSELFIYPGYEFKIVDKLITNFHLPKSTLIMLVSAFAGKEFVFQAYEEAVSKKYRFFSYGDCMFIE